MKGWQQKFDLLYDISKMRLLYIILLSLVFIVDCFRIGGWKRLAASAVGVLILPSCDVSLLPCEAANIPVSNGAIGNKRGTAEALQPIITIQSILQKAREDMDLGKINALLFKSPSLPISEKEFKRIFDEYSFDISYKQQYLDKNAFVVYYTQGFDGPNRNSIETPTETESIQTEQYFYRNEAWVALDEARSEVEYLVANPSESSDRRDLEKQLKNCYDAVSSYIALSQPKSK